MNKLIIAVFTFMLVGYSSASCEIKLDGNPPDGLSKLATSLDAHLPSALTRGDHGLESYCYKLNSYVVYQENNLGDGYILSESKPDSLNCITPTFQAVEENKMGIHIGMQKSDVGKLLKQTSLCDEQTVIWQFEEMFNGEKYYTQLYAELKFKNNLLVYISVFTTSTS